MLAALILAPVLWTGIFNVSIEGFAFVPDSVRVQPGDTVRWTNKDGTTHTSTGDGTGAGLWNSGNLASNATFQRAFTTAGSYNYHCNFHTSMMGKVVVGAASAIDPAPGAKPEAQPAPGPLRDTRGRSLPHEHGKMPAPASPTFPAP